MTGITVNHAFVSGKSDGTDNTLVQPSAWNASHNLKCDGGNLLGRATAGNGLAEQIPVTTAAIAALAATDPGAVIGVPIGGVIEWYDDTLPNSTHWAWANGTAVAAAVSPVLLARWGTRFGGDGVTTVGMPDKRERVAVGKSTMGGATAPGLITQYAGVSTLGSFIGEARHTMTTAEMVAHAHGVNDPGHVHGVNDPGHAHGAQAQVQGSGAYASGAGAWNTAGTSGAAFTGVSVQSNSTGITIGSTGSSSAFNIVQPGIVCNFIVRVA